MVGWSSPCVILQEEVQIADLVKNDGHVDHSWPINLIQLLDCVVFFEVEAENCVALLSGLVKTTDQ